MSDVHHQPRAHRVLQRALASQRMPHAYLFGGPDGVGKEMMALSLAQTLLCSSPLHREPPSDAAC
jgi:DNA polymerase-3 subunit delta'